MKLTIEINDRTGEAIKQFCKLNNMTYTAYLSNLIEKQFAIDRYGDMNEKLKQQPKAKQETVRPNNDAKIAAKKEENDAKPQEPIIEIPIETQTVKRRSLKVK